MKLLFGGALLFIKFSFFPNINLLLWMAVAVVLDFITGIIKAGMKGEARTSMGYRKTLVKAAQYIGAVAAGVILQNVGSMNDATKNILAYVNDGLVVFISYIEVTSIFENLYEIDSNTAIAKYFYKPMLSLLTFQIKNNPLVKQIEATKATEKP
jgi:phage-related holin